MPRVIQTINHKLHFVLHRDRDIDPRSSRCSNDIYINKAKMIRLAGFSTSTLLLLLTVLTILPIAFHDNEVEATTGTASSITMTTSSATASLNIGSVTSEGKFATSSGSELASFGVKTTNYSGYTLTITAADDAGTLVNTDTSITTQNTFSSITTAMDENTFDNSTYNGYWGYKPSKFGGVTNTSFRPSPTTAASTLDVTSVANPTTDNTYTIALGARASYTQATGTYSKTMSLVATANPITYSISYRDNTGDTVTNLPDGIVESSTTHTTTTDTKITLSSVTPSRSGYVFAGWCDVAPTNSGHTCAGNIYPASTATTPSYYGINQTATNAVILYATWTVSIYDITIKPTTGVSSVSLNGTSCSNTSGCIVSSLIYGQSYTLTATAATGYTFSSWYVDGLGNTASATTASTTFTVGEGAATITANARYTMPAGTTMQTFTTAMCDAMPEEQPYLLTDIRDNTMYTVAKLKDGKCWMTQNLKLGAKDSSLTLTSSDSNVSSSGFTLTNKLTDGKFPNNSIADSTTGSTSYYYDGAAYYCRDAYGCYYNSYTATAGSMTSSTGENVTVNYSICPAGWSLPTGGSGGQFQALATAYGGTSATAAANLLVANPTTSTENINGQSAPGLLLGGNYNSGGANSVGTYGNYWSRTSYSVGHGDHLDINTSGVGPLDHLNKYVGRSVRCMLQ